MVTAFILSTFSSMNSSFIKSDKSLMMQKEKFLQVFLKEDVAELRMADGFENRSIESPILGREEKAAAWH